MSLQKFKNLFTRNKKTSQPKKTKNSGTQDTIFKLKDMEEMLGKKQEYLEKLIDKEIMIARKNASKNKRVALQALKKKRRYAQQLRQIDGTLTTLEMQRDNLEGAGTNVAVLTVMQSAATAMKEAQKHLDIEKIHDILDDISEQQDVAKEISDAIAGPIHVFNDVDEDDLEKELEELDAQDLAEELLKISPVPPLPDDSSPSSFDKSKGAPVITKSSKSHIAGGGLTLDSHETPHNSSHNKKKIETEEDKELKELAEWAN